MSAKGFNPMRRQFYSFKLAHALFVSLPNWMAAGISSLRNETVKWAFLLGGVAFLLSSLFVFLVAQPTINVVDGPTYHRIGYHLAQEFQYNGRAYPYPLYPIFLAVIYALGGAYFAVYLVQGLLLALTVGLSYWLARHVAGHGAGVFAALLVTLDATLLGNVGLIATENLQTPLLMLAVMLSLHSLGQKRARYHIGAGVLWGIVTLVKPATLLWPPLLLPVYLVTRGRLGWRPWLLLVLAFMLTLSPWLLRNQLASDATETGQFHLPFAQGYPTLLIHVVDEGEARHDMSQLRPKLEGIAAEAAAQGIERDSFEFDLYTLRLLWQRVAGSPKAYARHIWSNFSYFWIEPPVVWPDSVYNGHWRFPNGYRQAPGFADHARLHSILVVMGLVSLLLLYWQSPQMAFLVTLFLLYYALFHTMYVVLPRFSVPVIPLVLVGAGAFPMLAAAAIKEKLASHSVLANVFLAATIIALLMVVSVHLLLQRPNNVQEGSFETDRAEVVWFFEESAKERGTPLVLDPYRARDGFRAAALEIAPDERGLETRMIQSVRVWFDATYQLKFSYLFTELPQGKAPLYVEVREWDVIEEEWKSVIVETLPVVANTWMEKEYEFQVSSSARNISVIFGLRDEPSRVLLDNVRLELATPLRGVIARPYLWKNPGEVNTNNYLPLERWVETQPQENRSFLLANVGVARANGWRGDEGSVEGLAYSLGLVVLIAWAIVSVLFARLRVFERVVRRRFLELGLGAGMVLLVILQAATGYLLLFSNPT